MTVTLCTSGAVKLKAGANRPTDDTVFTATMYEQVINQAESFINDTIRKTGVNVVNSYASLDTDKKKILEDAASNYAAMYVISYDMSGFTSRAEAQTMLDLLYAKFNDCIDLIKDKLTTTYMGL